VNRAWLGPGVAVLLLSGCGGQSAGTLAQPRPTPVVDYGPPPAGVPLLYVHDPAQPSWLIGFDWSGKLRGTVKLGQPTQLRQAPDGSAFEVGSAIKGGGQGFLDRLGQPISGPAGTADTVREMWADDNDHMCLVTLDQQTFTWGLSTIQLGQPTRAVAVIARDEGGGQSGIDPVACSFKNNLAILVRSTIAWPAEEWIVRLPDGKVLAHRQYVFQQLASVVASPDGAYVAENSTRSNPLGLPLSSPPASAAASTVIRRVLDNAVVASLDPSLSVLGFSGDGSRVLVGGLPSPVVAHGGVPQGAIVPSHLKIVEWQTGKVVWRYDGPEALGGFTGQPGGRDFAVGLRAADTIDNISPCGTTAQTMCPGAKDPLRDLVIVHGDGTTTLITGRYEPLW
jgi:hypothetical protein